MGEKNVRKLRVFVASPSDVADARKRMTGIVGRLNKTLGADKGVTLELWRWEVDATPALGDPQELINPELDEADVVVVILWNRFGTPTKRAPSGTAEEVLRSIERWEKTGEPQVMVYFCEKAARLDTADALEQGLQVLAFRDGLNPRAITGRYKTLAEFGDRIHDDLHKVVTKLMRKGATPAARSRPKRDPAVTEPSPDLVRYLKHVETTCGTVVLTGLLGDKAARAEPIEKVYVSLRATRPVTTSNHKGRRPAKSADAITKLTEALSETRGKKAGVRNLVPPALREVGLHAKEARRKATVDAVLARLKALRGSPTEHAIREILTTENLEEAFRRSRHLLVEGDPGSGKTTTLLHVAMTLVGAHGGKTAAAKSMGFKSPWPVPLFVALRKFRGWLADLPKDRQVAQDASLLLDYLRSAEGPHGGNDDWLPPLLSSGRAMVLIDGVDEVPDSDQRERVATIVQDFLHVYGKCRYGVTSRPAGLTGGVRENLVRVGGLAHCVVLPLDDGLQERFVRSWYGALIEDPADATRRADDLVKRIRTSPRVAALARTPIMLTAIAVVHQTGGSLPERRAELYEHCVRALSGRWDAARDESGKRLCGPVPAETKIALFGEVAFRIHSQGKDAATIERGPLVKIAQTELNRTSDTELDRSACQELVQAMVNRSGLLIPEGMSDLKFRHLTFQEFLAAWHVCDREDDPVAVLAPHLADGWWREVIPLTAGYKASHSRADARKFVRGLLDHAASVGDTAQRVTALGTVARTLVDLREYAVPEIDGIVTETKAGIVSLVEDPDQPGDAQDRVVIADFLGWFGPDPRLTDDCRWAAIPGGRFLMGGSDDGAFDDEKPVHPVTVPAFELQRWPVTVSEFRAFAEAGSYEDQELWGDRGWGWLQTLGEEVRDLHRDKSSQSGNHPVVAVSWWEARAYCRWRGARLPTEAEWEVACRAETTTRYWSGDDEADLARVGWHRRNAEGRAHAVATKPANPWGLHDMHGNVWEWCEDTAHGNYKGAPADGTAWIGQASEFRVFRGGGYFDTARDARSAYRYWRPPGSRSRRLGFRPARSVTT